MEDIFLVAQKKNICHVYYYQYRIRIGWTIFMYTICNLFSLNFFEKRSSMTNIKVHIYQEIGSQYQWLLLIIKNILWTLCLSYEFISCFNNNICSRCESGRRCVNGTERIWKIKLNIFLTLLSVVKTQSGLVNWP